MASENSLVTVERPWLFKPGQSGNPGGRPAGALPAHREQPRWAVRELAPAFGAAFGSDPKRAVMDSSSTLIDRMQRKNNTDPTIRRVALGVYEAAG